MAFFDVVRGLGDTPAVVVGFARGLLEAVAFGAIAGAAVWIGDFDLTILGINEDYIPALVATALWVKRTAEGYADQIDPSK